MKLVDVFMAFLVVVGGLQFVYCVLVGNYVRMHSLRWYMRRMGKEGGKDYLRRKSFANECVCAVIAIQCISSGI